MSSSARASCPDAPVYRAFDFLSSCWIPQAAARMITSISRIGSSIRRRELRLVSSKQRQEFESRIIPYLKELITRLSPWTLPSPTRDVDELYNSRNNRSGFTIAESSQASRPHGRDRRCWDLSTERIVRGLRVCAFESALNVVDLPLSAYRDSLQKEHIFLRYKALFTSWHPRPVKSRIPI
jgi:hypothetical protein